MRGTSRTQKNPDPDAYDRVALGVATKADGERPAAILAGSQVVLGAGKWLNPRVLIDCGAQGNFVKAQIAQQYLSDPSGAVTPVKAVDGHRVPSYRRHRLCYRVIDSGNRMLSFTDEFHAVEIQGIDASWVCPGYTRQTPMSIGGPVDSTTEKRPTPTILSSSTLKMS